MLYLYLNGTRYKSNGFFLRSMCQTVKQDSTDVFALCASYHEFACLEALVKCKHGATVWASKH